MDVSLVQLFPTGKHSPDFDTRNSPHDVIHAQAFSAKSYAHQLLFFLFPLETLIRFSFLLRDFHWMPGLQKACRQEIILALLPAMI
jgi:hypothetical protein